MLKYIAVPALLLAMVGPLSAQTPTAAEMEQYVRNGFAAWNTGDAEEIVSAVGSERIGFGYRTRAPRIRASREDEAAVARRFLAAMDYFRITDVEIQTAVDGGIGLAWGSFTEEFKPREGEPERVRVRFTMTAMKASGGWRQLLYHRDAQQFDPQGRYMHPATATR